ncbi:MAG: restriction endonuclease subunit S [Azoarcus sp.]|jgi:type I restriction enzyme S subunit|nr:restriction endonuclease subunit S [Azoarcus sp.]
MASEWRPSTWGAEVSLEYGKAIRGYSQIEGKFRVFGSNGPIGWTSEALALGPGVILGRKGAYRGTEFCREPFWVIDTAYYVVPKTELDMRWLYYAVKHYKLGEVDDGSPIPSTTRAAVYMLDLDVPPIKEQRAIAHILGTLDDKIELNRQMNATLEEMARAVFKDWFVDFESGEMPEGWRVGTLSDLVELKYGKALTATKRREGTIPVYGSGGVTGYHDEALVSKPTVIVGRKGTVGSLYWQGTPCFPIDTVFYVEPKVSLHYCYYTMSQLGLHNLNTDAAVPGLNRDNAYRQSVVIPSADALQKFDAFAANLRARMDSGNEESRTLATLRDTLLPKLISGELRVKDAEHILD